MGLHTQCIGAGWFQHLAINVTLRLCFLYLEVDSSLYVFHFTSVHLSKDTLQAEECE